jgi:hypothetical protein
MNSFELPRHNGNFLESAWECLPEPAWQTFCTASDRACTVTAITARWYYRAFLGAQAVERYKIIGELLGAIAVWAYVHLKIWCDRQVEAALEKPEPAEVLTPVSTLTFAQWVLLVVFKVHARILRLLRPTQTAASSLDGPQLQPCL